MSNVTIPSSYLCPITGTVMRDPYIDLDGNSFEKEAIAKWLSQNSSSPITRNAMTMDDLVPNRILREIIADFLKKNPSVATSSQSSKIFIPFRGVQRSILIALFICCCLHSCDPSVCTLDGIIWLASSASFVGAGTTCLASSTGRHFVDCPQCRFDWYRYAIDRCAGRRIGS